MTLGPNHALLHFHRFNKVSFAPSSWCEQVKQGVTPAMFRQTGCITSPMWSEFNPQCLDILISCLNLLSWLHSRMSKGGVESSWRLSWFCHLYPTFCLSLPTGAAELKALFTRAVHYNTNLPAILTLFQSTRAFWSKLQWYRIHFRLEPK